MEIKLFLCAVFNFILILNSPIVSGLFEFVCTEKGLFKPYIHVYKGRNGSRIFSAGPGFYDMRSYHDIYACVNGPAYLYFGHNSTHGEVFETPKFDVFAHICGVYNRSPQKSHTHRSSEEIKKLYGILLMGDPKDYRKPFIQLFTAPIYNYELKIIENATSIITFGNEECTLTKDGSTIVIKSAAPKDEKQPEYCIRAFGEEGAVQEEEDLLRATAPIAVVGCKAKTVTTAAPSSGGASTTATPSAGGASTTGTPSTAETSTTVASSTTETTTTVASSTAETSTTGTPPTGGSSTTPSAGGASTTGTPSTGSTSASPPKVNNPIEIKDCTPLPTLEEECKKGKPDPKYACEIFDTMTGAKEPAWSDDQLWRKETLELMGEIYTQTCPEINRRLPKLVNRLIGFYLVDVLNANPSSQGGASATGGASAAGGTSATGGAATTGTPSTDTTTGTPPTDTTTGTPPIDTTTGTPPTDTTTVAPAAGGASGRKRRKREIIKESDPTNALEAEMVASQDLDSESPVAERIRRNGADMSTTDASAPDLTSTTSANPGANPTSVDSGANPTSAAPGASTSHAPGASTSLVPGASTSHDPGASTSPAPGTDTTSKPDGPREVWKFIKEELQNCLRRSPRLHFEEQKQKLPKTFVYKKEGKHPVDITHFVEEADNEYSFNWVIDTHWKMFATVLGICSPSSKIKASVIASRLYITYIEDFLIPLNNTWIEFKDNLIFQFILGEYYNKETDAWLNNYLEASFIETNSKSYRPLRPLLVNDLQDDNYFLNTDDAEITAGPEEILDTNYT